MHTNTLHGFGPAPRPCAAPAASAGLALLGCRQHPGHVEAGDRQGQVCRVASGLPLRTGTVPLPAFEEPSGILAAVPVEQGCGVCANPAGKFPMKWSAGDVLFSLVPLEFGSERHGREPAACC